MGNLIEWMGYKWIPHERWGIAYKDNKNAWMDPTCVQVESDYKSPLHLLTRYSPRFIPEWDQIRPIAFGLVSCTEHFSYGTFTIEAKLPDVPFAWPAFWMYSWESWPPEIDFFEAYANKNGSYFKADIRNICQPWKIETNLHLPMGNEPYAFGKKRLGRIGCRDPKKHFLTYEGRWFPDEISVWVNGRLSYKWDISKSALQQFKPPMNLIIGTNVQPKGIIPPEKSDSDFIVKSFDYRPL
jgi:hypothetical protein